MNDSLLLKASECKQEKRKTQSDDNIASQREEEPML